jgi:hypothetical protein
MSSKKNTTKHSQKKSHKKPKKTTLSPKVLYLLGGLVAMFLLVAVAPNFAMPSHLRSPVVAHYHFRMQLFIDGEYIDFSQPAFQEDYTEGVCDGLTETPIHFHDGVGQYVHIHWVGITGGEVLKYYGLNRIGGLDQTLGYRFDRQFFERVPILTNELPQTNDKIWIYQIKGDEAILRSEREFLSQDLEEFFGVKSSLTLQREEAAQDDELFNVLSTNVYAHPEHGDDGKKEFTEDELKDLNDVLGDILVFVQDQEPSEEMLINF